MFDFYRFALSRLSGKVKCFFWMTMLTAAAANAAAVLTPILQRKLIAAITAGEMDTRKILAVCLVSLLGIAAAVAEALCINALQLSLKRKVQWELLGNALRCRNPIIGSKGPGAYMVSVFGDGEQVSALIETNVFSILFQCIGALAVIFITARWSPLFLEIVIPAYILMAAIQIISNKLYVKRFQAGREKIYELNPKALEYIENRGAMLGYANIPGCERELKQLFDERDKEFNASYIINTLSSTLMNGIRTVAVMLFFVCSMYRILDGRMDIASFVAMTSYFSIIFSPIMMIKQYVTGIHKYKTVKAKIKGSLARELHFTLPENEKICWNDCSFVYEGAEGKKCVEKLTLAIDRKIAVVGLSGEGKTTVIKLLLGELEPTEGSCTYGNRKVSEIVRYVLYSGIRYYSQDVEIFNRDLQFNIAMGKKPLNAEEYGRMQETLKNLAEKCLEKVKLSASAGKPAAFSADEREFLMGLFLVERKDLRSMEIIKEIAAALPEEGSRLYGRLGEMMTARSYYVDEKYRRLLKELDLEKLEGRPFGQRGCRISGGEKNRVAMARFLLPEYGEYFILDEPFANLDLLAEDACMKTLLKYSGGMKGILISHKLNVVRDFAEKICVMEDGRITAEGSHEELAAREGLYRTLYEEFLAETAK